jgi:hypothetical protein
MKHKACFDDLIVADVNQHMFLAQEPQQALAMTRAERDLELGLWGELMPQVVMEVRAGRHVQRECLSRGVGPLQMLEDSGLLEKVLRRLVCPHYRTFEGRVYFQFCRPLTAQ